MNEPTQLMSPADMQALAQDAAKSGMFGLQNPSQAICLMAICQAEGLNPVMALRRYHLIEGKPSMRADAMLAEFLARGGGVMWHVRTDKTVAATFFADSKKMDQAAVERSKVRFEAIVHGDEKTIFEQANPGEDTIIRTIEDATAKGTCMSWKDGKQQMKHVWKANPRQMLTARVITEGVRLIAPGVVAGIYAPEELEDSREAFLQDAGQAPDRDLAAMQEILHQHEQDALAALTAGNEREAKRQQSLAAEMRMLIQEKRAASDERNPGDKEKLANVAKTENPSGVTKQQVVDHLEKSKPEPADDIPMQHATDLPKDLKMVKGSEVPQPKKKPVTETPPAVPPTEEKEPVTKQASEPGPAAWRDYVIQRIPSFKGRPLGSLTDVERKTLHKKRGTAALPEVFAKNPGLEPQQKAEIEEDAKWIDLSGGDK